MTRSHVQLRAALKLSQLAADKMCMDIALIVVTVITGLLALAFADWCVAGTGGD